MPSKNWRKEWDIAEEDLPLGAHIYEGVTAFDLEELRTEMTGLRIVPPSAKAEKGAEETKPHFESALEKEQIKGWLEEWEPYDHRIHFYPYDMNSKNKVNGKLMDNWIDLHLTKVIFNIIINLCPERRYGQGRLVLRRNWTNEICKGSF